MFLMKKALTAAGLVGALAIALIGCGGDSPFQSANDSSRVRLFNAVVGAPGNGSIFVGQRNALLNANALPYGQTTTAGLAGNPNPNYGVVATGTGVDTLLYSSTNTTTIVPGSTTKVDYSNAFYYTIVAIGIYDANTANANFPAKFIRLTDNIPTLQANQSAIRLVHAAPGAPTIGLYNNGGLINGLGNVSYGNSSGDYTVVTSGAYTLTVRDNANNIVATPNLTNLGSQHVYTIFVTGQTGNANQPVQAIVTTDL